MASYGSDYVIWPTGNQDRSYLISFQQNFPEKINLKDFRIIMSFYSILEPEMLFQNICLLETDSKKRGLAQSLTSNKKFIILSCFGHFDQVS